METGIAAVRWRRLAVLDRWLSRRLRPHGRFAVVVHEFVCFGLKQASACLFGGLMVALILATWRWYPADAAWARYDFLTVAALAIQLALLGMRLESLEEAKVIVLFHVVGTLMELFKTSVGSWVYPEASLLRLGGVPLFSGFMYASIGSYIARAWRLFDFRFTRHPPFAATVVLAGGHLRQLLHAPLSAGHPLAAVRRARVAVRDVPGALPDSPRASADAAAAGFRAGGGVHLAGRERRHAGQGLAVSGPAPWLAHGAAGQAGGVAAADGDQLRDGVGVAPAGGGYPGRALTGGRKRPAALHFPANPATTCRGQNVPQGLHDCRLRRRTGPGHRR